jgi:hypothetical protein
VRLQGSLDAFSLSEIFGLLGTTKKTGALHLRRADAEGVVHVALGCLTAASADVGHQVLSRRLVAAGLVPDEQLAAAVRTATADRSVGVARALREAGAVTDQQLHAVAGEQVVDAVFDLLRWPDGEFSFQLGEPNPEDVGLSLALEEVLAEARRRLDVWPTVTAALPSPDSVLSLAPNPPDELLVTREEWGLLALVDGRRTVGELIGLLGRGEFAVVHLLAGLVTRGLLRAGDSDGLPALLRRLDLLAGLERPVPAAPPPAAPPPAADAGPPRAEPTQPQPEPRAEAAPPQPPAEAVPPQPRPEPAPTQVEERKPESEAPPEPAREAPVAGPVPVPRAEPAPASRVVATSAVAEEQEPFAFRDPNVNRSLLLRLIAGVQGL